MNIKQPIKNLNRQGSSFKNMDDIFVHNSENAIYSNVTPIEFKNISD